MNAGENKKFLFGSTIFSRNFFFQKKQKTKTMKRHRIIDQPEYDISSSSDEDKEENKKHWCIACSRDFNPFDDGTLGIFYCDEFVGAKQDLSGKTNLKCLTLWRKNLSGVKLPENLNSLRLFNVSSIENYKFPNELRDLRIYGVSTTTTTIKNLQLPDGLNFLILKEMPNVNLTDFRIPNRLKQVCFDNVQHENNIEAMLIANGYYDEEYLQQDDEYTSKEENGFYRFLRINDKLWEYKKRCINLNSILGHIRGWDWHLNIVIDNYCGFIY